MNGDTEMRGDTGIVPYCPSRHLPRSPYLLWIVGLVLLTLTACASNVPEPTLRNAGGDENLRTELCEGRRLYVDKCSGCHALHSVDQFSGREWTVKIEKMISIKKVKLNPEEKSLILRYLTTLSPRG